MDEVKRNQFVARLSRALGRDQVPTTCLLYTSLFLFLAIFQRMR